MAAGNNNATLEVEVVSKGIADTVRKLDSLGNAAERNEKKVVKLTDSLKNLMTAQESAVQKAVQHSNLMSTMAQAMQSVANSADATARSVQSLTSSLTQLQTAAQNSGNALDDKAKKAGVVNTTLRAMLTAATAYLSVGFAKGVIEQADAWGMMQAKLKLAVGTMEAAKAVQGDLFVMAQKYRAPLEDMGRLYTRLSDPMRKLGKSSKETMDMVEGVSLALKLGGATAAEASSTMLQFSQAAAAGRLNGAEFNSVSENGTLILKALEESLGKSRAELKKMGADGVLTFDLINDALQAKLPQWRKDFESLPLTVEGAVQRIKNAWFKAIGEAGQETELGKKLAESLGKLEEMLPSIAEKTVSLFATIVDNAKLIGTVLSGIIGMKLVGWIVEGVLAWGKMWTAASAAAAALSTTAAAAGTAAAGVGVLRTALHLLGGPLGIITGLLTAGVAAWMAWGKDAPKESENATSKLVESAQKRIDVLNAEIEKLKERNEIAGKPVPKPKKEEDSSVTAKAVTTAIDNVTAAQEKYNKLKNDPTSLRTSLNKAKLAVEEEQRQLTKLLLLSQEEQAAENVRKEQQKISTEMSRQEAINAKIAKDMEHFAKGAAKTEVLIAKARKEYAALGIDLPSGVEAAIRAAQAGSKTDFFSEQLEKVRATTEELKLQAKFNEHLTATEKARIKLSEDNKFKALPKEKQDKLLSGMDSNITLEKAAAARELETKAIIEAGKERERFNAKTLEGINKTQEEIDKTKQQITALHENKTAVKDMVAAKLEEAAATAELAAIRELDKNGDEYRYNLLKQEAEKLRELAGLKKDLGRAQDAKDTEEELDKLLNPKKAFDFGSALASAFGTAGKALGQLTKGLDGYFYRQEKIAKLQKEVEAEDPKDDAGIEEKTKKLMKLKELEKRNDLKGLAEVAGATKMFFKEHSKGYRAMHAVEQTFRAFELAATLQNNAAKLEGVWAYIAAKGQEVWAMITGAAVDKTTSAQQVALSGTKAAASTAAGSAKAFEQMGVWGFVGAAAIVAFMASMGVSAGGSGSAPSISAQRQQMNGTGKMPGAGAYDWELTKSESLSASMDILSENSDISLEYTQGMLAALRSIRDGISGMSQMVARTVGLRGTYSDVSSLNLGTKLGGIASIFGDGGLGNFMGSIFGKTTQSLADSGIVFHTTNEDRQTIGKIRAGGLNVQGYNDIETKKKNLLNSKTSLSSVYSDLPPELVASLNRTINSMYDAVLLAGKGLGKGVEDMMDRMNNVDLMGDAGLVKLSLKGKTTEEVSKELEAAFGALGDAMASKAMPGLESFIKGSETYLTTLVRVSSGVEVARVALEQLGITAIEYTNIANKQGDVSAELVRDSIVMHEAGNTIATFMSEVNGSAEDLVDTYKTLLDVRGTMRATGLGSEISRDFIRGGGGLDNLQSSLNDFVDKFFTDAEKSAIAASKLQNDFARIGISNVPKTREEFRKLVTTLSNGDIAAQALAGQVLQMSGVFGDVFDALEDSASNARDALKEAYDNETEALEKVIDTMGDAVKSLNKYRSDLLSGNLSPLTNEKKYENAVVKFNEVLLRRNNGDKDAIKDFEDVSRDLLEISRVVNASGDAYTSDFNLVLKETEKTADLAKSHVDVAESSLKTLQDQYNALLQIKENTKSFAQAATAFAVAQDSVSPLKADQAAVAIESMYKSILGRASDAEGFAYWNKRHSEGMSLADIQQSFYNARDGSHANGLDYVPFDGYRAELHEGERVMTAAENRAYMLNQSRGGDSSAEEIRMLREEIKQLRAEQAEQTNNLIRSNYDAQQRGADTVVGGTRDALNESQWKGNVKVELV